MELQRPDKKKKQYLRSKQKADLGSVLRKSWYHLRLSVRHPTRVPTWDAIVLTAASPEQAQLYNWQLSRAKRMGRISSSTVTLAVPDPHGQRIGSGAATLNAIYALACHYKEELSLTFDPKVDSFISHCFPDITSVVFLLMPSSCCDTGLPISGFDREIQ